MPFLASSADPGSTLSIRVYTINRSCHGVVDKPITLYTGFPGSIPGFSNLLDETEPETFFHKSIAVGGMLNTYRWFKAS